MTDYNPQFTFGFEIEGVFHRDIYRELENFDCEVYRKGDGSVHWSDIAYSNKITLDYCENSSNVEYNVGVFSNKADLLKAIDVFKNKKNYWNDNSCGLHLHIKPKTEIKKGKELFWDLDLIKKLEKFAYSNLCDCVKKRKNNRFCENYEGFERFYIDIKRTEKYRFVRNHPSGTMEFRFFSPCEHKVENVDKFLTYLTELLSKQKHKKSNLITLDITSEEKVQNYSYSLSTIPDKYYNFRLGEKFSEPTQISDTEEDHDYDEDCDCDDCVDERERDDDEIEF